jgi:hypothetical protein
MTAWLAATFHPDGPGQRRSTVHSTTTSSPVTNISSTLSSASPAPAPARGPVVAAHHALLWLTSALPAARYFADEEIDRRGWGRGWGEGEEAALGVPVLLVGCRRCSAFGSWLVSSLLLAACSAASSEPWHLGQDAGAPRRGQRQTREARDCSVALLCFASCRRVHVQIMNQLIGR